MTHDCLTCHRPTAERDAAAWDAVHELCLCTPCAHGLGDSDVARRMEAAARSSLVARLREAWHGPGLFERLVAVVRALLVRERRATEERCCRVAVQALQGDVHAQDAVRRALTPRMEREVRHG